MKAYLLIVALALVACGKKNDLPILEHEASQLAKYYQPKLEEVDRRIVTIMERGRTIPADFPGVKETGMQLQEALDMTAKLRGMVGAPGPGKKSPLETQAEAAAKDGKLLVLQKLVHDAEETMISGMTIINADLEAVESWIHNYDHKTLAMVAPATPEQAEPPSTPATGPAPGGEQGSAAPAQGSAAPTPQQGSAAQPKQPEPKPTPKTDPKQPNQPKPPTAQPAPPKP